MAVIPTKANLMAAKKSLSLARLGYELLDRKQSIMIREMTALADEAKAVSRELDATFAEAYAALRRANISVGARTVEQIAESIPVADDVSILRRSVMGVEIPEVRVADGGTPRISYGMASTSASLDDAYIAFIKARRLAAKAAQTENSFRRLEDAVRAAKKRVGALSGVVIPRLEEEIAYITASLEERERDSFISMKVVKRRGESK